MFYAFVEKVEKLGRLRHVRLEVFPAHVWEEVRRARTLEAYDEPLRASVVEFVAPIDEIRTAAGVEPLREDTWRLGHFDAFEGIAASEYRAPLDSDRDSDTVYVSELGNVSDDDRRALTRFFSLRPEGVVEDIGSHRPPAAVVCVNVGQGACAALCDSDLVPFAYFDVGAGCYANARTRPAKMELCLSNDPVVVLSHWDADHWYGAVLEPRLVEQTWLAPVQKFGPVAAELIRRIRAKGKLIFWPGGKTELLGLGVITKCSGRGRNNGGLAWIVPRPPETADDAGGYVLLPGDCDYKRVPHASDHDFLAVLATHSAHCPSISVLSPTGSAQVCYSYGVGNSYAHPHGPAVERYYVGGWHRRLDTPLGNVSLAHTSKSAPGPHRCSDSACGFRVDQW